MASATFVIAGVYLRTRCRLDGMSVFIMPTQGAVLIHMKHSFTEEKSISHQKTELTAKNKKSIADIAFGEAGSAGQASKIWRPFKSTLLVTMLAVECSAIVNYNDSHLQRDKNTCHVHFFLR